MRLVIAAALSAACSGSAVPERPVPATQPAAVTDEPKLALDGPRLGLYRLDTEHLRPQLVELMGDEIDEVKGGRAWLVLDRDAPPMVVWSVERTEVEELALSRHLTHFKLAWVNRERWPPLECRAESRERIACSVVIEDERRVRFRLLAVDESAAPGLPAPGIYRQVVDSAEAQRTRRDQWLAGQGVAAEQRRELLARMAARPALALIEGDVMLEIEPTLSVSEGGFPPEVELAAFVRELEPRPGGFRARRAEAPDTFFDCEIGGEISCRDGEARWRYVPR